MNWFQLLAIVLILGVTLAGGYFPFARKHRGGASSSFPLGQAFAAGVFLALSLVIMLPNGAKLLASVSQDFHYPVANALMILSFVLLLALGHWGYHGQSDHHQVATSSTIAIIMTIMIAIPSFLLGTALAVSDTAAAIMILVAILAHKGSAGFALALAMVRSPMSRQGMYLLFGVFALATPLGIIVGAELAQFLSGHVMNLTKGCILSAAAGVFLYMATLHELRHTPMIVSCCTRSGFVLMIFGLVLTMAVRWLLGVA